MAGLIPVTARKPSHPNHPAVPVADAAAVKIHSAYNKKHPLFSAIEKKGACEEDNSPPFR